MSREASGLPDSTGREGSDGAERVDESPARGPAGGNESGAPVDGGVDGSPSDGGPDTADEPRTDGSGGVRDSNRRRAPAEAEFGFEGR
jgi:hypothetical protein